MNISEIRAKYPQYDNLSDEQLAEALHKKYYSGMPFDSFAQKIGYQPTSMVSETQILQKLQPLSPELRAQPSGDYGRGVLSSGLKGFGTGLLGGLESGLNGATLGGYNWLARKLGLGTDERQKELQALAESEGLGGYNKAANFVAGLGGGFQGLPKLTAGLGAKVLSEGLPLYIAGGAADAGIQSAFDNDFSNAGKIAEDTITGGAIGGALAGIGKLALNPLINYLSANAMTKGIKGGLNNVADNPKALRLVNDAIKRDDDIAQLYLNQTPEILGNTNKEAGDLLNSSLTRRIDVPKTVANQKRKYRDFMEANAGQEVLDFSPKEEIEAIQAKSKFTPNKKLSKEEAEALLRDRAALSKLGIYNDEVSNLSGAGAQGLGINHFFSGNRRPYVRTLHNTLDKPDLRYSQNGRNYAIKKYTDNSTGKDFYDFVILDNGELFNKFPTNSNYVANRFKNGVQDVSLNAQMPGAVEPIHGAAGNQFSASAQNVSLRGNPEQLIGAGTRPASLFGLATDSNSIMRNGLVVNPKLPHISKLYEGLTPYQAQAFDDAIIAGAQKSNNKLGSLDSLNRVKQELNDRILGSQRTNPYNGATADTANTVALRGVKKRVDTQLGEALKGKDKGYHKAKQMEEAYGLGLTYNPNNIKNIEAAQDLNVLEKNAFAQGMFDRITRNTLANKNLAKEAMQYNNSLRDVLPRKAYNNLKEGLGKLDTRYRRLSKLGTRAENKLQMPESSRLFLREQLENPLSTLGSLFDEAIYRGHKQAVNQAARNLLNPNFVGIEDNIFREQYPTLTNYLSAMFANEN